MHVDVDARIQSDLERLVAIPSIAFAGFPREPLDEAAALVEELLRDAGAATCDGRRARRGADACSPTSPAPGRPCCSTRTTTSSPRRPTGWDSDPFAPTLRDGRLYGRGAADDKSGIVAHLAALRAFDGKPPVHVKVLIEGSEENGRQKLLAGRRRAIRS